MAKQKHENMKVEVTCPTCKGKIKKIGAYGAVATLHCVKCQNTFEVENRLDRWM